MKIKELRQKTEKELKDLLDEDRFKLAQFKFDLASKKLKNIKQLAELRKDIARILTISKQKEQAPQDKKS